MLSYLSKNLEILVFCTILEKIPHWLLGFQMLGIDQSIDLDKDCDQFAWGEIRMIFTNFHEVQLSQILSS